MLDNRLSSCLQVHGEQTLAAPARLALDYTLNGSLADCGCKSAFASYRVQAGNGDPAEILMEDRVRLDGRNRIELALTAGTPLPTGRELQLVLGCARPD